MAQNEMTRELLINNSDLTKDDLTVEVVRSLYWEEGFSQFDIADVFNTRQASISYFMRNNDIETRDHAEAVSLAKSGPDAIDSRTETPETAQDARESTSFGTLDITADRSIENRDDGIYAVTTYTVSLTGVSTEFTTDEETLLVPDEVSL